MSWKKRAILGLVTLALVSVGVGFWWKLWPAFVEVRLIRKLRDVENEDWASAAEALLERRSTRGLPVIVRTVLHRDRENGDEWERRIVKAFTTELEPAVEGFREALTSDDQETRRAAIEALRRPCWRRSFVVPLLGEMLESDDAVLRWQAAYVLSEFGTRSVRVASRLIRAAEDASEHVRWAAVRALAGLAPVLDHHADALSRRVLDPNARVGREAIRGLALLGEDAEVAVPQLIAALSRPELNVEAAIALAEIGPTAKEAVAPLAKAVELESWPMPRFFHGLGSDLEDEPSFAQQAILVGSETDGIAHAIVALARVGASKEVALPILKRQLSNEDIIVASAAAAAACYLGPAAADLTDDLVSILGEPKYQAGFSRALPPSPNHDAAHALACIGSAAVPSLVEQLRGEVDDGRFFGAVMALGWMGPQAEPAIPDLRRVVADELVSGPRRAVAAAVLSRHEFVPNLVERVLDWKEGDFMRADGDEIARSARVDPTAVQHLDRLIAEANSRRLSYSIPHRILEQLADLAPEPTFAAVLESVKTQPSVSNVALLARFPTRSAEAVPALTSLIRSSSQPGVRLTALESLVSFGTEARSALPAVLAAMDADLDQGQTKTSSFEEFRSNPALFRYRSLAVLFAKALGAIAPGDSRSVEVATDAPENIDDDRRLEYLREVSRSDADLSGLESFLIECAERPGPLVSLEAARILWRRFGRRDLLLERLEDNLAQLDGWQVPHDPAAQTATWNGFRSLVDRRVAELAAEASSELGERAEVVEDVLRKHLESRDLLLRVLAAKALWKIRGEPHLEVLCDVLARRRFEISPSLFVIYLFPPQTRPSPRSLVLEVLREMGPSARPALPALQRIHDTPGLELDYRELRRTIHQIRGERDS